jgi:hypothetical protein
MAVHPTQHAALIEQDHLRGAARRQDPLFEVRPVHGCRLHPPPPTQVFLHVAGLGMSSSPNEPRFLTCSDHGVTQAPALSLKLCRDPLQGERR